RYLAALVRAGQRPPPGPSLRAPPAGAPGRVRLPTSGRRDSVSSNSFFFILNPAANRGRARLTWGQAQSILDQGRIRYEVATTERPGEAVGLAERAALDGWPAVVAVGGDGTIHEVANGLMR